MHRPTLAGNVVDWSTAKWEVTKMESIEMSQSMCTDLGLGAVAVPELLSAPASKLFCHKLNGEMYVLKDDDSLQTIYEAVKPFEKCSCPNCPGSPYVWSGWFDEPSEGSFVNMESNEIEFDPTKFSDQIWADAEPNGDEYENCLVMNNRKMLEDLACDQLRCSVCKLGSTPVFTLRGLCQDSIFDAYFGWTGEFSDEKYDFRGFSSSFLFWNESTHLWMLTDRKNDSIYATTEGSDDGYPFGTNIWTLSENICPKSKTNLSFTACSEQSFNCFDGICIDIGQRCGDGHVDCLDNSDEKHCDMIEIDKDSYLKDVHPPPLDKKDDRLKVFVEIDIRQILELDEVKSLMSLQLRLKIKWTDPRIDLKNLKQKASKNMLTMDEMNQIWVPTLLFSNTKTREEASFENQSTYALANISNGMIS